MFRVLRTILPVVVMAGCEASANPAGGWILVEKGAYQTLYSPDGKINRLLYDANGDGRADMLVMYGPYARPDHSQIDTDLDGVVDRWESFDTQEHLVKVGRSRKKPGVPDAWDIFGTSGEVSRREYDEDGDGKVDRTEYISGDRAFMEEVDTDGDGKVNRRTVFRPDGTPLRSETLQNGIWQKAP